jgi:MFS transporter, PAT family, beta-lactamase induction signal transducer AmpG
MNGLFSLYRRVNLLLRGDMRISVWKFLGAERLPEGSRKKLGIVALLYFIQGAPVAILWEVLPVYLRLQGISLAAIGGLRLLELPYSLKVFWSPLVHRYGDRRVWICGCMAVLAVIVGSLPFMDVSRLMHVAAASWIVFSVLLLFTTLSATQDIAIDSYSVGLVSREEEGAANGVRASAYRIALVLIGAGMVFLAAAFSWTFIYLLAAVIFLLLAGAPFLAPRLDLPAGARSHWMAGFTGWIGTWRAVPLVVFVLIYKLGDFAIGPMIKPFWVDQGRSVFEIGLIPTAFGIVLSIAGSLAGGGFIARYGIFRGVWILGLLHALANFGYAVVAWGELGRFGLYGASVFESFSAGLGTAAFLAFLMNVCDKEHATVQYAFLSSIFSLTGRLVGGVSGLGAERIGYANYFALTFLASLPAFALLPWIKSWIREAPKEN